MESIIFRQVWGSSRRLGWIGRLTLALTVGVVGILCPVALGQPAPDPQGQEAPSPGNEEVQDAPDVEPASPSLLDLDTLAPESPGSGLRLDLQAKTLQGLPANMAAMILGGRQGGQVTLVPLAVPILLPNGSASGPDGEPPRAAVALLVEIDGPSLFGPTPAVEPEVQIFAYALTANNEVAGFLSQTLTLDLAELGEAVFAGGLKFAGHLELPPGDYTLRVLVHEPTSQRFGLSRIEVTVPTRATLLTPLVEEPAESPWLMVGEAPHGAMGALDLGRVLELAGSPMPSALPLLRGREVPMDLLLFGAAGSSLPAELDVEVTGRGEGGGEGTASGPLAARVISRQATALPGLERLRVGVPLEALASGSYRLRFSLANLNGAATTSAELPVVVLPSNDTASLWTDIQRRLAGDAAVSLDMTEVDRRRRGRQQRAREAVAGAYRQVLLRLANGERDAALENLVQIEREVLESGQEAPMALLVEAEDMVLQGLADADPQALLPVMMLHGRAYDIYLRDLSLGLSTYSRDKAIAVTELYAERVASQWNRRLKDDRDNPRLRAQAEEEIASARRIAANALASFGAYLQTAQVRMAGRALLRRALELDPENAAAMIHLAAGLEKTGDYLESVAVLERLIEIDPKAPEGRLRLGVNLRRLEREEASMRVLSGLLSENNPDWVLAVAYQEMAAQQLKQGHTARAVTTLEQAVGRLPAEERLLIQLAYALDRSGDTARARQMVVRLQPESATGPRVTVVPTEGSDEMLAPETPAVDTRDDTGLLASGARDDGAGPPGSPRHRYNRWPESDLTSSGSSLSQAAMARLTSLGNALAQMPALTDLDRPTNRRANRRRENR